MASKSNSIPKEHHMHRTGGWLPEDHRIQKQWLEKVAKHVDENPKDLNPILREFKEMIEEDTRLYLLFSSMFEQLPNKKPYSQDPEGHKEVRDVDHMLLVLNHLMVTAPEWSEHAHGVGVVGLPMAALFDRPMSTPSGFGVFLDPKVNAMLKKVLNFWGSFLTSPDSAYVLGTDAHGWFGPTGGKDLTTVANEASESDLPFEKLFICDPSAKNHGYNSWDHFFTREFRFDEGVRPVAAPDHPEIIANACESTPYNVAHDVKLRDRFWVKGQPYSIQDMLARDILAEDFVGGTIYQAFLSALSYHRWHSPIAGRIVKAYVKDGSYFSEPLFETLADPYGADLGGQGTGQGYITATASRAMIFIEADNKDIGLMCVLLVGMVEVSTNEITVEEGQHVEKGEQLGMFHFGGSTHCLLFRKGVDVQGFPQPGRKTNVPVRSELAVVRPGNKG